MLTAQTTIPNEGEINIFIMKSTAPWKAKSHRPDYEEIRMQIIEAAWDIASEQGVKNLTLNQVAKEAGCARSSVYRYFDSKEQLLTAVISEGIYAVSQDIHKQLQKFDNAADLVVHGAYLGVIAVRTNPALRLLWFGKSNDDLQLAELTMNEVPKLMHSVLELSPIFVKAREDGLFREGVTSEDIAQWLIIVTLSLSVFSHLGANKKKELAYIRKMLVPSFFKDN